MKLRKFWPHIFVLLITLLAGCSSANTAPAPGATPALQTNFKHTVVSLTFDDGDADNYSIRPVLAEYNLHATFYIVSGFTGKNGYLSADQLRGLHADGNEIGGHTLNHINLDTVRGAALVKEVCQDRLNLLAYGFQVTSFAYPFGHYDKEVEQIISHCGYNSARTVVGGPDTLPPNNAYTLQAMPYIVKDTRLPKMLRYVTQVEEAGGGWAIFVFHHVCNGCDQYSVAPDTFKQFASWLNEAQANGLVIKTIGEVIGGETKPGVSP